MWKRIKSADDVLRRDKRLKSRNMKTFFFLVFTSLFIPSDSDVNEHNWLRSKDSWDETDIQQQQPLLLKEIALGRGGRKKN
jgi:hypothetical protein